MSKNTKDSLMIGFDHNHKSIKGIAQCVVDEIFGEGYLTALEHLDKNTITSVKELE